VSLQSRKGAHLFFSYEVQRRLESDIHSCTDVNTSSPGPSINYVILLSFDSFILIPVNLFLLFPIPNSFQEQFKWLNGLAVDEKAGASGSATDGGSKGCRRNPPAQRSKIDCTKGKQTYRRF